MREEERVPIVIKTFKKNPKALAKFIGEPTDEIAVAIKKKFPKILKFWSENADLRFGQMLCVLRLVPNIDVENRIWDIEEMSWLTRNEYINKDE